MSIYAIGDIQGCAGSLRRLLAVIHPNWSKDSVWITGDLVNRGPDSLGVLREIKSLQTQYPDRVRCVLGNHDIHLLMTHHQLTHTRKGDTLQPVLNAHDREELIDWLHHQPLLYREGKYIMVHAGLLPSWTENQAEQLASEAQHIMLKDPKVFLEHVYGNKPEHWNDELEGIDRYRVIINAMTRIRFCTAEGHMEFHSKGQPQHAPDGFIPWYSAPHVRKPDTIVLFGHWSQLGLRRMPGYVSLDSGCLWEGTLTAIRLEDNQFFQVPRSE